MPPSLLITVVLRASVSRLPHQSEAPCLPNFLHPLEQHELTSCALYGVGATCFETLAGSAGVLANHVVTYLKHA